jgi:hypothetical protein
VIRGWTDGSDRATQRRGEAGAAVHELLDRIRARRLAKQVAQAQDEANDEYELRYYAELRAQMSAKAKEIADQYPIPTESGDQMPEEVILTKGENETWEELRIRGQIANPHIRYSNRDGLLDGLPGQPARKPNRPNGPSNGAPMPDNPTIPFTELQTLDQLDAEIRAAFANADAYSDAIAELSTYLLDLPERYSGASDLYKTRQMNAAMSLLAEQTISDMQGRLGTLAGDLHKLLRGIDKAKGDVKESDAQTGRVESAIAD